MSEPDPTLRFSNRVEAYVRHRPDYPAALVPWLREQVGLAVGWEVADIGAGTGISSKLLLDAGCVVTAVEPNAPMRTAAERALAGYARFRAVDGRGEATGLAEGSVDLVTAAQAFHWFDADAVRKEWRRILRPDGYVAVFWNTRRLGGTPFLAGYERLVNECGTDYAAVTERQADAREMRAWFGAGFVAETRIDHGQSLDFAGLRGRLLSSSYAPPPGAVRHEPMIAALRELFDATAKEGRVELAYDTQVFVGRLT